MTFFPDIDISSLIFYGQVLALHFVYLIYVSEGKSIFSISFSDICYSYPFIKKEKH